MIRVFKKKDQKDVENYRPVSVLPNLLKIHERCLYNQVYKYFNHTLTKCQCGFGKGFGTQRCLLAMINKGGTIGAISIDLLKGFISQSLLDFILHELLITEIASNGFDY